jgi:hypothetical protein
LVGGGVEVENDDHLIFVMTNSQTGERVWVVIDVAGLSRTS